MFLAFVIFSCPFRAQHLEKISNRDFPILRIMCVVTRNQNRSVASLPKKQATSKNISIANFNYEKKRMCPITPSKVAADTGFSWKSSPGFQRFVEKLRRLPS